MKKLSLLNFRLLIVWTIITSAMLGLAGKIFLLQFLKTAEFKKKQMFSKMKKYVLIILDDRL